MRLTKTGICSAVEEDSSTVERAPSPTSRPNFLTEGKFPEQGRRPYNSSGQPVVCWAVLGRTASISRPYDLQQIAEEIRGAQGQLRAEISLSLAQVFLSKYLL
jgi:hypothetical protein